MTTPIHTSSIALMEPPPDVSTLRELEAAVIIGDNDRVLCFLAQAQPMDAFVRKRHARQLLRIALSVNNKELAQALVRFLDPRDLLCRYRGGGTALERACTDLRLDTARLILERLLELSEEINPDCLLDYQILPRAAALKCDSIVARIVARIPDLSALPTTHTPVFLPQLPISLEPITDPLRINHSKLQFAYQGLVAATAAGYTDLAQSLLAKLPVECLRSTAVYETYDNDRYATEETPALHAAAKTGNTAVAEAIIQRCGSECYHHFTTLSGTALHCAAQSGSIEICKLLLNVAPSGAGLPINSGDSTPLHIALVQPDCKLELIELLSDSATPSGLKERTVGGYTPLGWCMLRGFKIDKRCECAKIFIRKMDPDALTAPFFLDQSYLARAIEVDALEIGQALRHYMHPADFNQEAEKLRAQSLSEEWQSLLLEIPRVKSAAEAE